MLDVLIVEDNLDINECLMELLKLEGYRVRSAADGEAGLAQLRERFPDVIILDVEMPLLDGPGMARRMLLEDCGRENIPIVLSSALVQLPEVAARLGTPYYIIKPYDPAVLLTLVARAIQERIRPAPQETPKGTGAVACPRG